MINRTFQSFLLPLILGIALLACNEDAATPPDEVVRMYQAYVDQNEFSKAASLSTPSEQQRLKELEQMIQADAEESILYTTFESIECAINGDKASCECQLNDQYESYEAVFNLVKVNKEWLVDLPEEQDIEYDEEIEAIIDSLMEETNN